MDRNVIPHDPRHLGVLSGVFKMILEPVVHSMQAVHLSCSYTKTLQMERNEVPHDLDHLGVLSGVSKGIFESMVRTTQTVDPSCVKNSTTSKWTERSIHLKLVT
jgi:hypothetical protein